MGTHKISINCNRYFLILYVVILIILLIFTLYIASSNIRYRYNGPLTFGLFVLLPFSIIFLIVAILMYLHLHLRFIYVFLFSFSFLIKYLVPYYLFNGHVNYDTPVHYLASLYLRDYGIETSYHYHLWPLWLILNAIFDEISRINYPLNVSIVAIIARFLVTLFVYIILKHLFTDNKIILIAMWIHLIFEPVIIHPAPQIVAFTMLILLIYLLVTQFVKDDKKIHFLLILIFTAILLYHATLPLAFLMPLGTLVILQTLTSKIKINNHIYNKRHLYVLLIIFGTATILYNAYIALFVTKSIVRTIDMLLQGGYTRLDVYSIIINDHLLNQQYLLIQIINRLAMVLLLFIPSFTISLYLLLKSKKLTSAKMEKLVFIILIFAGVNGLLYLFFGIYIQLGLVERFYQVALVLSPILTAYFYLRIDMTYYKNFLLRIITRFLLICVFIFLPLSIFTSSAYVSLYIDAFSDADINLAKWVSLHLPESNVYLDGNNRLNQLIVLYAYPHHIYKVNLTITRIMEKNVIESSYKYPPSTIISLRILLPLVASTVPGLSDDKLRNYIDTLPNYLHKVFSNGATEVFVAT